MEGLRAWPKPPGDAPVALRWLFAERHVTAQLPLGEPRGWLKNKRPWESGHTVYKPYLAEPLVLILGRAPRAHIICPASQNQLLEGRTEAPAQAPSTAYRTCCTSRGRGQLL